VSNYPLSNQSKAEFLENRSRVHPLSIRSLISCSVRMRNSPASTYRSDEDKGISLRPKHWLDLLGCFSHCREVGVSIKPLAAWFSPVQVIPRTGALGRDRLAVTVTHLMQASGPDSGDRAIPDIRVTPTTASRAPHSPYPQAPGPVPISNLSHRAERLMFHRLVC